MVDADCYHTHTHTHNTHTHARPPFFFCLQTDLQAKRQYVASGGHDGLVKLWGAAEGICLTVFGVNQLPSAATSLCFSEHGMSHAGNELVVGHSTGNVRVWTYDEDDHKATKSLTIPLAHGERGENAVLSVASGMMQSHASFETSGKWYVCTGGADGTARLFQVGR